MFTWNSSVTRQQVDALTSALHAMRGTIPGLISIQGGPDLGFRPGNSDYLLVAAFEDEDAWRFYQAHPAHKAVVTDMIGPMAAHRQSMQAIG